MIFIDPAKTYRQARDFLFRRSPEEQVDNEKKRAELGAAVMRGSFLSSMAQSPGWKEVQLAMESRHAELTRLLLHDCQLKDVPNTRARLDELETAMKIVPEALKKAEEASTDLETLDGKHEMD